MISWKKMGWFIAAAIVAGCNAGSEQSVLNKPPVAALTDSIASFPGNTGLLLRRAELLSQLDQHELAYEDYTAVWAKDSSEAIVGPYVSNLFLVNRPAQAIGMLEDAARRFPGNPDFRRRLSEAYLQTGRSEDALAQYENMLTTDSTNFEAWFEKGLLHLQTGDTPGAINSLSRSYLLQPLSMNGLVLANLYAETRNPLALAITDEITKKDSLSQSIDPVFIKGIYYSNTNQYQQALQQFDACIRADWKFSDAYIEKGIILFELNNIDEALLTFKMANTVSPGNADGYYWQGRCYEAAGKKEEALENYVRAYSLDDNFPEAKAGIDRIKRSK